MSLLLAPYNNGMRLGQGFNSYTQQICVDDAVVVDPDRVDNAVTNDGFTMRELRYAIGARAGDDDDDGDEDYQPYALTPPSIEKPSTEASAALGPEPPTALDNIAIQLNQDVKTVSKLVEEIANLESALEEATDSSSPEVKRNALLLEKKRMRLARIKTSSTGMKSTKMSGSLKELSQRGPSQIVSYNSRFVNKISEITDDMNISGSLSIKYGAIGGSGKGSFVDSDKFKESDLNFFISVKVINQSINMKDALVFQGLPSVDETNFRPVFGDTFVSGFLEGGEFNALVSIKVVNKDKRMAIKAEAEVALSVGIDLKAQASVSIAKMNFSAQTETTIQVGWSGGGHIKPMDVPWTIETLMQSAAKFPDLVARTPQRTYAILTKYEALRSFMALKPPALSPMYYENAAIYTNSLLDSYMDYKNIYRTLSSNLFDIQAGTKKLVAWPEVPVFATNATLPRIDDDSCFEATIKGLDLARRACRFQMIKIVREVDQIEKRPDLAADELRGEVYQSPIVFRERLPTVKNKEKLPNLKIFGDDITFPPLLERTENDGVNQAEVAKAESYAVERPDVGESQRLAPMVGSTEGTLFCNLDFVKPEFSLRTVTVELHNGVVSAITVRYSNGLLATLGTLGGATKVSLTIRPEDGEKIIACSIETGRLAGEEKSPIRVTAVRLFTNRGPDLFGNAEDWIAPGAGGKGVRGGFPFVDLKVSHFDPIITNGHIKGFWGYGVTSLVGLGPKSGIYRLAPIWGNKQDLSASVGAPESEDPATIVTEAESFYLSCRERLGWKDVVAGRWAKLDYRFEKPLPFKPMVIYGLRTIDTLTENAPRVGLSLTSLTETGLTMHFKSFLQQTYNMEANIMVLPNGKIPFQQGFVEASDNPGGRSPKQVAVIPVTFEKPFNTPPKATSWFTDVAAPNGNRSIKTWVDNITTTGMNVTISSWADRQFDSARVAWLAWPSEFDGKTIRCGAKNEFYAANTTPIEMAFYGGSFSKEPKVFCALNCLDFPPTDGIGCTARIDKVTKDKVKFQAQSWKPYYAVGLTWIAIE